jgi:hypothetical protein
VCPRHRSSRDRNAGEDLDTIIGKFLAKGSGGGGILHCGWGKGSGGGLSPTGLGNNGRPLDALRSSAILDSSALGGVGILQAGVLSSGISVIL